MLNIKFNTEISQFTINFDSQHGFHMYNEF